MFSAGQQIRQPDTIRTSDDRFLPARYHDFLYTSRFASALGIWPWSDVFMSGETNNLLISNLSAGPVGTGDEIGKENRANILKAIRADGVIIKPDTAVVPWIQLTSPRLKSRLFPWCARLKRIIAAQNRLCSRRRYFKDPGCAVHARPR